MTFHGATFWVGANAVLRKRALDDVVQVEYVGDWPIRRYIQDRTVIEDTESSIDLATHGWSLLQLSRAARATAPRRRTSARCASSATAGRTAAC